MDDPWIGALVRLRAFEINDAADFAEYFNDGAGARLRGDKMAPYSSEALRKFVEDQTAVVPAGDEMRLLVDLDGAMVGSLRTYDTDVHNGRFSFHISIAGPHRRQGYAADASRIILDWFFDELRYHKCVQSVFAFNPASIALHERLGFTEEGRLKEAVFSNGAYHDEILFGMSADEHRTNRA